jgi:hypothetical protein
VQFDRAPCEENRTHHARKIARVSTGPSTAAVADVTTHATSNANRGNVNTEAIWRLHNLLFKHLFFSGTHNDNAY